MTYDLRIRQAGSGSTSCTKVKVIG